MKCPVTWFEICGKDAGKTREFYSKLFDWKYEVMNMPQGGEYAMLQNEAKGIGGGVAESQGMPYSAIYVEVDNPQSYIDKANKLGAKTVVPPTTIPGMVTFALFTDP